MTKEWNKILAAAGETGRQQVWQIVINEASLDPMLGSCSGEYVRTIRRAWWMWTRGEGPRPFLGEVEDDAIEQAIERFCKRVGDRLMLDIQHTIASRTESPLFADLAKAVITGDSTTALVIVLAEKILQGAGTTPYEMPVYIPPPPAPEVRATLYSPKDHATWDVSVCGLAEDAIQIDYGTCTRWHSFEDGKNPTSRWVVLSEDMERIRREMPKTHTILYGRYYPNHDRRVVALQRQVRP